jgi:Spy/CpxP family protein refolding chaperone
MMKKNMWFILLAISVFLPSALMAQEMMHGKWWMNKTLTDELQLSDTERNTLEEKYMESRRKMIDLKSEVEKQQLELDLLLDQPDANKEQIIAQYDLLENARSQLSKERFRLLIEMRDILGTERYQSLREKYRDRTRNRMDRGFKGRRSSRRGMY